MFIYALLHINQRLVFYYSEDQGKWISESDGLKNQYRQRSIPLVNPDLLERLKVAASLYHGGQTNGKNSVRILQFGRKALST